MTHSDEPRADRPTSYRTVVADALPALDERLSDELDKVNAVATYGVTPARELTVQVLDDAGELAAGLRGGRGAWPPASG